jgi:hypothetical protein
VKPAQEQRSSETIAKEIAAALFIIKPYALNLPFGRSKSKSDSACTAKFAAHYRAPAVSLVNLVGAAVTFLPGALMAVYCLRTLQTRLEA